MTELNLAADDRAAIEVAATQVLVWLAAISEAAHARLTDGIDSDAAFGRHAQRHFTRIQQELLESLQRATQEPFVARVRVEWEGNPGIQPLILVTRTAQAAAGLDGAAEGAVLASSRGPWGRIAEYSAGEYFEIATPRGLREGRVIERLVFRPERSGQWDALDDQIQLLARRFHANSLRALLDELRESVEGEDVDDAADLLDAALAEAATILTLGRGRRVVERMALRDQAILDQFQGEVFRRPVDQRLLLLGPPGTGKTTTLIKRIAQKRNLIELSPEEYELLRDFDVRELTWRMYSPSDLLALYLREAFAAEGVPAGAQEVTTWEQTRNHLVRNVFPIVKTPNGGRFRPASSPTLRASSSGVLRALHDELAAAVESDVVDRCVKALDQASGLQGPLATRSRPLVERLAAGVDIESVLRFGSAEEQLLATTLRTLDEDVKRLRKAALQHLRRSELEALLDDLARMLEAHASADAVVEQEEDADDDGAGTQTTTPRGKAAKLLQRAFNQRANDLALGRSSGGSKVVREALALCGDRMPDAERLQELGVALTLRRTYKTLREAARRLVDDVPRIYAALRRRAIKEDRLFVPLADGEADFAKNERVTPDELDVLLLVSLRNARRLINRNVFGADDYRGIEPQRVAQVYVDEVTDFSPVELACMLELSNEILRSFFACGDFRQRVTQRGISTFQEFAWISRVTGSPSFELCEIERHYRQSPKLVDLARGLAELQGLPEKGSVDRADEEDADPQPLLAENLATPDDVARWLSERIGEVERDVGQQVSIAIFVDREEAAAELTANLRPLLEDNNIVVQHCRDGRDAGYESEVRVFDVKHVKGLEFEAVFFVSIDRLAERLPELFHRFLYVGVTRAATYLGLTCHRTLPPILDGLRAHFSTTHW